MELQKPRGTRDFLFEEMKDRKFVENTMRKVFEPMVIRRLKLPYLRISPFSP
jgi:histidyl-tRNA synthetase